MVAAGFDERTGGMDPVDVVTANALGKAREVAARAGVPDAGAVLGADTEVVRDGVVLGKPPDPRAAAAMLAELAGRAHEVITGIALITAAGERTAHATTRVVMRPLTDAEIRWERGHRGVAGPRRRLCDPGCRRCAVRARGGGPVERDRAADGARGPAVG